MHQIQYSRLFSKLINGKMHEKIKTSPTFKNEPQFEGSKTALL